MYLTAPLGKLTKMVGGGTPSKRREDFWSGTVPWVSPKDMSARELRDAEDHISGAAVTESSTQIVPEGSVLVVVRSGILVRRFPIAIARVPVALNQDMKALLPGGPLLPEFLAYALEARESSILRECVKRGATVHSIDVGKLQRTIFPVPAKSEQSRIVDILDQAGEIRALRAEADAKAERIVPAFFVKIFGDPSTNPKGWATRPLGDVTEHVTSGSRGWSKYTGHGEGSFLRTQDVNDGEIAKQLLQVAVPDGAESERTRLASGDVVVTITGVVGKAAVFRGSNRPVYVSQHVALVRPKASELCSDYLAAYANLPIGKLPVLARFQYGQTKPGLGFHELRTARIPLPPIELQTKFADYVNAARADRFARVATSKALSTLWQSLLSRAFSGQLTASWRAAHMKELIKEMEEQARTLSATA
jgi:type I restriction enzyme, S subunit